MVYTGPDQNVLDEIHELQGRLTKLEDRVRAGGVGKPSFEYARQELQDVVRESGCCERVTKETRRMAEKAIACFRLRLRQPGRRQI